MRKIILIFGGGFLVLIFLMDVKILHEFRLNQLFGQKRITKINILNLNYLDKEYILNSIKINPLTLIKNDNISGIKTYKFWWVLILLLSVEWYVRKKVGLL